MYVLTTTYPLKFAFIDSFTATKDASDIKAEPVSEGEGHTTA